MRRRHFESVSSRSLSVNGSWGTAPSVFWFLLYAQKERPGGEPYRPLPCGESAPPLGEMKLLPLGVNPSLTAAQPLHCPLHRGGFGGLPGKIKFDEKISPAGITAGEGLLFSIIPVGVLAPVLFALFIVLYRIDNITRNGQHHHNKDHLGHCAAQQAADGPQCLTEPGK